MTEIQKYELQKYRKTNYRNTEILISPGNWGLGLHISILLCDLVRPHLIHINKPCSRDGQTI